MSSVETITVEPATSKNGVKRSKKKSEEPVECM